MEKNTQRLFCFCNIKKEGTTPNIETTDFLPVTIDNKELQHF